MNVELLNAEIQSMRRQRYQFLLIDCQQNSLNDLYNVIDQLGIPSININTVLASRLRDVPISRRMRVVKDELQSIVNQCDNDVIFFNRIHYLFDEELKQDPIGLIEYISGNKVILVSWPGEMENGLIRYGTPDHPEYFEVDGYEDHIVQF